MKYWLIIFFMTPQGEYIGKREVVYSSKVHCQAALARVRPPQRNVKVEALCVSDDHRQGRRQDPGVPYD